MLEMLTGRFLTHFSRARLKVFRFQNARTLLILGIYLEIHKHIELLHWKSLREHTVDPICYDSFICLLAPWAHIPIIPCSLEHENKMGAPKEECMCTLIVHVHSYILKKSACALLYVHSYTYRPCQTPQKKGTPVLTSVLLWPKGVGENTLQHSKEIGDTQPGLWTTSRGTTQSPPKQNSSCLLRPYQKKKHKELILFSTSVSPLVLALKFYKCV